METSDRQPLVGRFVHLAVVMGVVLGCAMLGWSINDDILGVILAAIGFLTATALWWGTSAANDPERSPFSRVTLPGPIRLLLELGLVVGAGIGIWIVWNRAASETFLTVAALDFAVRYQRIAALLRGK